MLKRAGACAIKADQVSDGGGFEGYLSVFNELDDGGDVVMPGAFAKSIGARGPKAIKLLREHNPQQIIGEWTTLQEDGRGLYAKGQLLLDLPLAKETHTLMRAGLLDGLSIGYRTEEYAIDRQPDGSVQRKLIEVDLWEGSIVTFPMLDSARVDQVKAIDLKSQADLERALITRGFDLSLARELASHWTPPEEEDPAALFRRMSQIIGG